ncbi:MAG: hypothetical protein UHD09_02305 [Bifidobacterium sp.]|nr:hypothetical protein [Bifidobacterium sp.]
MSFDKYQTVIDNILATLRSHNTALSILDGRMERLETPRPSTQHPTPAYEWLPGDLDMQGCLTLEILERLAQLTIDDLVATHPELTGPHDMDLDGDPDRQPVGMPLETLTFDYLLERVRYVHCDIAERLYLADPDLTYTTVARFDHDGHVTRQQCALIADRDHGSLIIDLDDPLILHLVTSDLQRPVGQRIGVLTYLIGVAAQFVGMPGFPVRRIRQLIGTLRELIGTPREPQRSNTTHGTHNRDGQADNRESIHTDQPTE